MEVVTAFFFDAAGLSSFFFLEPDARAEDGEERLPSPSSLRFLDEREEAQADRGRDHPARPGGGRGRGGLAPIAGAVRIVIHGPSL